MLEKAISVTVSRIRLEKEMTSLAKISTLLTEERSLVEVKQNSQQKKVA